MNRTVLAFIVAPLWVPLIVGAYATELVFSLPNPGQSSPIIAVVAIISAVIAYLITMGIGLPTFLWLRSRGIVRFWCAPAIGFLVGAIVWLAFGVFALGHGSGIPPGTRSYSIYGLAAVSPVHEGLSAGSTTVYQMVTMGLVGALVGATIWLIARPDRANANFR
jgi:hypothetical protein